jgi:integrase
MTNTVKFSFTQKRIDDKAAEFQQMTLDKEATARGAGLEPSKAGHLDIWDEETSGLVCRFTKRGGTYYLSKWADKAQRWIRIGTPSDCTVKQARTRAVELISAINRNERPWEERKTLKEEATLADLWEHYRDHASGKKKASSRKEDESLWRSVLEPWGGKKRIGSISRGDVQRLINTKGKATPTRANRTAALLSSMFNKAIAADLWKGANPAKGVERFREVSRDRFLRPDELRAMFASLAYEDEGWKVYFLAALLCGARRSNLLAMKWADLDLNRGLWRVDAEESKNGQTMQVDLPPEMLTPV